MHKFDADITIINKKYTETFTNVTEKELQFQIKKVKFVNNIDDSQIKVKRYEAKTGTRRV